jgi:hypothetical protein
MKRNRVLPWTVVVLLAAFALVPVARATFLLRPSPANPDSLALLLSSDASGVSFQVDVPWNQLLIEPAGAYLQVALPGWSTTSQSGAPALPMLTQSVGVPFDTALSLIVEAGPAHTVTLAAAPLPVTSQSVDWGPPDSIDTLPVPRLEWVEDPAVYGADVPYPAALATLASDGVLRQQRVAGIALYPVQYDPASRQLTIYEWLKVSVLFETPPESAAQGRAIAPESVIYEDQLSEALLNYASARTWRSQILPSAAEPATAVQEAGALALPPWTPPQPGWRVKVREDGIYRLTSAELATAGLPVDTLVTSTLQLFHLGVEVPIIVESHPDASFDILFYGQASNTKYAIDNVYWLTYGQAAGLRMPTQDASPGPAQPLSSYAASRHMEVNASYFSWIQGDDDLERWLWASVYFPVRPSWSHTFSLPAPLSAPATLSIHLQGYLAVATVNPDHHARISLNGTLLGNFTWDGRDTLSLHLTVPAGVLLPGDNTLTISAPGDTGYQYDIFFIDTLDLAFPSLFLTEDDVFSFSYAPPGSWVFPLDGFSSDQVFVYDVTDPHAVIRLAGASIQASGAAFKASFQSQIVTPRTFWAATATAYRSVQTIETDTPSNLSATTNAADQIIITHPDFASDALRLRNFRASQGLRSALVDVQDVYDEFGYGIAGVAPIHDFLAYAYANWQAPAPSYVVLVGDGHYDPKGYMATGQGNFIPAFLAMVDPWIGETAVDNRYVTIAGNDTLPDMMLGRLAVNTPAEAAAFVDKIIAYEQNPLPGDWQTRVLAVADNEDSAGPFHLFSDALLRDVLPSPYVPDRVYLGVTHPTITEARTALLAAINSGRLLVNYIGHGAITQWAAEGLFKTSDVAALTNTGRLPVILAMTCYDGYFHHPTAANQSTAETVTRAQNKGAIASWSPTGLGVSTGHDYLNRGFFQTVFYDFDGSVTLGQATTAGLLNLWTTGLSRDLVDTFTLFGDPATQLAVVPYRIYTYLPVVWR